MSIPTSFSAINGNLLERVGLISSLTAFGPIDRLSQRLMGASSMNLSSMFWVWIGITALFIVGEIFTAGFFLFPFAVGAGVAAILTVLGAPAWLQWLTFIVVSAISMLLARRFAEKVTKEPPEKVAIDRVIGEVGLVIEAIDPVSDSGMVRIKKDEWRATSLDGNPIEEKARVRVVKVEGAHLVVEKIEQ